MMRLISKLWGSLERAVVASWHYMFGETVNLAKFQEGFVFDEMTKRSVESTKGVFHTFVGPRFYPYKNIYIFTGEQYINDVSAYGDDPVARQPFNDLTDFLQHEFVINHTSNFHDERTALTASMRAKDSIKMVTSVFNKLFENWDPSLPVNDEIDFAVAKIISYALYGANNLPRELIPFLRQGEHAVFNRRQIGEGAFEQLRQRFKELNNKVTTENEEDMLEPKHPTHLKGLFEKEKETNPELKIEDLNPIMALIVTGNLSALLTGIMLQLAVNPVYMQRLRDELKDYDLDANRDEKFFISELKNFPFLHSLYLEGLRFYAPAGPLVRETSQKAQIGDIVVPANSTMIVPTRAILHDPKYWADPHIFNPDRGEFENYRLNHYPFVPFSTGKRQCPASYIFIEAIVLQALVLLKDYDLDLTSHNAIEVIPARIKEPRLTQLYFATLQKHANDARSSSCLGGNIDNSTGLRKSFHLSRSRSSDGE